MTEVEIKQGEGRWLRFTLTGTFPSSLADATMEFGAKLRQTDTTYALNYLDADIDKTLAASGIIRVQLLPADTALLAGGKKYFCELEVDFGTDNLYKTPTFLLAVEQAIVKDAPVE